MSAYISARRPDRVEILSDAAMCRDGDFALTGIISKCLPIPGFPLAITGRGDLNVLNEYAGRIAGFASNRGTVDAAMTEFAELLADEEDAGRNFPFVMDFLIAGWSETEGPFHRLFAIGDGLPHGLFPFEVVEIPDLWCGGTFDLAEFDATGIGLKTISENLESAGADLFEAWRRKPVFSQGNPTPIHGIGGQLHKTTVTEGGVEFEPLGYWPDLIGKPIVPAAGLVRVLTS